MKLHRVNKSILDIVEWPLTNPENPPGHKTDRSHLQQKRRDCGLRSICTSNKGGRPCGPNRNSTHPLISCEPMNPSLPLCTLLCALETDLYGLHHRFPPKLGQQEVPEGNQKQSRENKLSTPQVPSLLASVSTAFSEIHTHCWAVLPCGYSSL